MQYVKELNEPLRATVIYYGRELPCWIHKILFGLLGADNVDFICQFDNPITITGPGGSVAQTSPNDEVLINGAIVRADDFCKNAVFKEISK